MILSVSRRTDIPAFYCDWFFNRLKEGYVSVRNPMYYHHVSNVKLSPEVIDCIVFWTKNPSIIVDRLHLLQDYLYYFHVTINGYDNNIERFLPPKDIVIANFIRLSEKIGKKRVIWRYDPIILNNDLTIDYHIEKFHRIASQLENHTEKCVISFVDPYEKTIRNTTGFRIAEIAQSQMKVIGKHIADAAQDHGIKVETCSEGIDLSEYEIQHTSCIDKALISVLSGYSIIVKDDKQRDGCCCSTCIDIGAYNTCKHGCTYCYATFSDSTVKNNCEKYNPNSSLIVGEIGIDDKVTDRKMVSYKSGQISFDSIIQ